MEFDVTRRMISKSMSENSWARFILSYYYSVS